MNILTESLINKIYNYKNIELYQTNKPINYIIIDDFLDQNTIDKLNEDFEIKDSKKWIYYFHYNENKLGLNNRKYIPESINEFIDIMNSSEIISSISKLTNIENLVADDSLEGGGMHVCKRGGYLNIHADFELHPHKRNLKRRVNAILFLNRNWKEEYNGYLEFWDKNMTQCVNKVAPTYNRLVIFRTSNDSYHGFPDPIMCPNGVYRKSIALYYFSECEYSDKIQSTNYKARPQDGLKSLFIWLDKKAIYIYTFLKSKFGINDALISKILRLLFKK